MKKVFLVALCLLTILGDSAAAEVIFDRTDYDESENLTWHISIAMENGAAYVFQLLQENGVDTFGYTILKDYKAPLALFEYKIDDSELNDLCPFTSENNMYCITYSGIEGSTISKLTFDENGTPIIDKICGVDFEETFFENFVDECPIIVGEYFICTAFVSDDGSGYYNLSVYEMTEGRGWMRDTDDHGNPINITGICGYRDGKVLVLSGDSNADADLIIYSYDPEDDELEYLVSLSDLGSAWRIGGPVYDAQSDSLYLACSPGIDPVLVKITGFDPETLTEIGMLTQSSCVFGAQAFLTCDGYYVNCSGWDIVTCNTNAE